MFDGCSSHSAIFGLQVHEGPRHRHGEGDSRETTDHGRSHASIPRDQGEARLVDFTSAPGQAQDPPALSRARHVAILVPLHRIYVVPSSRDTRFLCTTVVIVSLSTVTRDYRLLVLDFCTSHCVHPTQSSVDVRCHGSQCASALPRERSQGFDWTA